MGSAPMLGRAAGRHGSCCGGPQGLDCADYYKGKKPQRYHEKQRWKKEEEMAKKTKEATESFDMFEPADIKIVMNNDPYWARAAITHLPTGLTAEARHESSTMIAKRRALRELKHKLAEHNGARDEH